MRISDWSSDVCSSDLGGVEVTSDGAVWGGIGILVDVTVFDAVVLTGSFAPGLYEDGNGKNLGHTVEFRSQVELGYQFENRSRLSLGFSHTSNGSLRSDNPGVEVRTEERREGKECVRTCRSRGWPVN